MPDSQNTLRRPSGAIKTGFSRIYEVLATELSNSRGQRHRIIDSVPATSRDSRLVRQRRLHLGSSLFVLDALGAALQTARRFSGSLRALVRSPLLPLTPKVGLLEGADPCPDGNVFLPLTAFSDSLTSSPCLDKEGHLFAGKSRRCLQVFHSQFKEI